MSVDPLASLHESPSLLLVRSSQGHEMPDVSIKDQTEVANFELR